MGDSRAAVGCWVDEAIGCWLLCRWCALVCGRAAGGIARRFVVLVVVFLLSALLVVGGVGSWHLAVCACCRLLGG